MDMDMDDDLYELWQVFFDKRRAHLAEREALSRARHVALLVATLKCQQDTIQAERRTTLLLVDVERVQQRIRAGLFAR